MGADTRWGQAWENVSDRGSHLEIMTSSMSDTAKDARFLVFCFILLHED